MFGGTNARYRSGLEELSKDGFKSPESKSKSNFKSPESKSKSNEASSVRTVGVPGLLQLHLQPLHPDLETIHRLYRSLKMLEMLKLFYVEIEIVEKVETVFCGDGIMKIV